MLSAIKISKNIRENCLSSIGYSGYWVVAFQREIPRITEKNTLVTMFYNTSNTSVISTIFETYNNVKSIDLQPLVASVTYDTKQYRQKLQDWWSADEYLLTDQSELMTVKMDEGVYKEWRNEKQGHKKASKHFQYKW